MLSKNVKLKLAFILALKLALLLPASVSAAHEEPVWRARSGPWGNLEVRTVYLEAPDSLLAAIAKPNSVTRWVFEQTTEAAVRDLILRCGVPAATVTKLLILVAASFPVMSSAFIPPSRIWSRSRPPPAPPCT